MFSTEPEIGSTANSYAILAKLATGGMAEIFLARTASAANVERYVVLKRVHRHRATDIKFVNMFLDEARLAAQLQHPNIAQVFDTGKLGDSYFFTMEYVHGETVRELMHRSFALGQHVPIGCALTIIAGAAAGLQHAHDRVGVDGRHLGIVHRDVSPSNLMVTFEGNVKVVDFGVAKASHRSSETQSGTVKGKIGYMSPEQCRGGNVDRRCDLFCLGIVLWELLVGERLFKRGTDFESMEAVVHDTAPPPSKQRFDISPELDAIVLRLLQKSPADRYQSADELLEDIENVAVRTGMGISVAALRRYVRELFGQRPEPWVELRLREARTEVVTVTGAPAVHSDTNIEPIDEQLERLLDLSTSSIVPVPAPEPPAPRMATAPTVSAVAVLPQLESTENQITVAQPGSSFVESSASIVERPTAPRRSRRWVLSALAFALATGAVITVISILRGDTGRASATVPEPQARTAPVPPVPSPPPAPPPPATDPEPAPPVAAVIDKPPDREKPARSTPRTTARAQSAAEDIASVYRAGRFGDVVASCAGSAKLLAANAVTCTLAACRQHDESKAKRWLASAPAGKRSGLVSACGAQGVTFDAPKPPPEPPKPPAEPPKCDDSDPMACRK